MIFDSQTQKYLKDEAFDNGACINLKPCLQVKTKYRDNYLLKVATGKKILHFGFVDHLPLIDEKINNNSWLHSKLDEVSELCYGVDINAEGIDYLKKKYKLNNLLYWNVLTQEAPNKIKDIEFDYILIPDVIEHIGNPVLFLESIKTRLPKSKAIILTTPNAFRLLNYINNLISKEVVNTDHRFWFTPYTLSKIVVDAGYIPYELGIYEHSKSKSFVKNIIIDCLPSLKDTLIIKASL